MASKSATTAQMEALEFQIITETYTSPTHTRRRVAGMNATRTGYCETNANGTGEFDKLAGTESGQFLMKIGTNEAKGLVAAYVATEGEEGAITVRRTKDKKVISFHLGHIFDRFPTLRPPTELFCTLKYGADKQGVPCIIINLRGSVVRKGRSSSTPAAVQQG